MKRVYLDYNSTTPLYPEVFEAMLPYLKEHFGNPSNLHFYGRETKEAIENARVQVADLLNAAPEEIFFTSGGTEANNWAIKGIAYGREEKGHIIGSPIEHGSVFNSCRELQPQGYDVTFVNVDSYGIVDPDDIKKAIKKNTILITVMHSNNEVGTIEPIREIAGIAQEAGVRFHTDAVASCGKLKLDVKELGVDLLTISAHKIHGPKGSGALYVKNGIKLEPIIHGGHQEQGMRAGTENLPGIVGLGKACSILKNTMDEDIKKIEALRDRLEQGIFKRIPEVRLNGHPKKRLVNTSQISVAYVEGEALLVNLDLEGVAVASGSACASGSPEPSPVLKAMNVPPEYINSPIRFSLGRENTIEDIDYAVDVLEKVTKRLRDISPLWKDKK
ncbi:MAG: cysteine desulfurase NifS [candidate division WOR-3 bacterium]|nr:cysteine desulfurase NifS [candidate division WOR-3 bacterium]